MNRLADLAKTASQHDCEQMLNELDSFRNTAAISDGAQQRILSSVMKKAGFEMDNAISITERKQNRQNRTHTEKPEQVSVVRRGRHVLAACIAFAVIAATAGAVIFGGKINIEPRKPQPRSVSDVLPESAAPEGQAAVPDITGLNEEEAKRALEDAGFVPVKIEVYDNDQKPGDVAFTDPGYGTTLPKGSEVCYFVSMENFGYECNDLGINFDTDDKEELYEIACRLYNNIMKYHGDTIDRYNADNGTEFSLEKPQKDFSEDRLRDMDYNYNALLRISHDGMYDYIAKSFMTGTARVPDVQGLTEDEAVQRLRDAGFVPYRHDMTTTYAAEGRVACQREYSGDELEKGTIIGYSISKVPEEVKAVPDYDGDVYEDDDLYVKVDKLMCDGSFFFVEYTIESKTETWQQLSENYHDNICFADTGEELEENYEYINFNTVIMGGSKIGVIESHLITPEMAERGVMLDIYNVDEYDLTGDEPVAKSDKKDRLLRIPLECNVPTRTLSSEDGLSIVLSPMGISSQNYDGKSKDISGILTEPYQEILYVTKDGQRIEGYDYYPTKDIAYSSRYMEGFNNKSFSWSFFGFKDIDNVESVEINGVVFR